MTPAARISAAIEILDFWLAGQPVEQVLTNWGRANRYAGSGDRRAIRDLVYDALRRKASAAWVGGAETGRGLMLGLLWLKGMDPRTVFTGERHAPAPLLPDETRHDLEGAPAPVRLDCPAWLWDRLGASLGDARDAVLSACQSRAPVFLRVNLAKTDRDRAVAVLAREGIAAQPHAQAATALEVTEGARGIAQSEAYALGLVELQDAASQAVVLDLPIEKGMAVLDYCAGGGGKALALAALGAGVTAHDVSAARMRDLEPRARRAGAVIHTTLRPEGRFPLVLVDAPCSGSGTWRRDPEAKWRLTEAGLERLLQQQAGVFRAAARHVQPGGALAWVTCSVLTDENEAITGDLLAENPSFGLERTRRYSVLDGGDGFGLALLRRNISTL